MATSYGSFLCGLTGVIALALSGSLWLNVRETQAETDRLRTALERALEAGGEEKVELADVMAKLERHANKLYFSGRNENWRLAAFYLHELEETIEEISGKNVMEGQVNVSAVMEGLLIPELDKLGAAVHAADRTAFLRHYKSLTVSCNACHEAAEHAFIVIQEPRTPVADSQNYEVSNYLPASNQRSR